MGGVSFGKIEPWFQTESNAYVKSRGGNEVPGNMGRSERAQDARKIMFYGCCPVNVQVIAEVKQGLAGGSKE